MKFSYSVIGDNTQENREWLEKVGYKQGYVWSKDSNLIFAVEGTFCIDNTNAVYKYARIYDNLIDCRGNVPLFKAVSAMREDSDFGQLFERKDGLFICQYKTSREHIDKECKGWDITNLKKLNLEELQERFKE